jgi:Rieske 2Fe-2S family protein
MDTEPDFIANIGRVEMPIRQAETLPAHFYYDNDIYRMEIAAIWNHSWQLVAQTSQLRNTGDFVTVRVAEFEVIVVRAAGTNVRAFVNVCRHRGATLIREREGNGLKRIVCPFHAWCYDLDGRLVAARSVKHIDKADWRLDELAVEVWRGLVFVNIDRSAPVLAPQLAGFAERLKPYPVEGLSNSYRMVAAVKANWKIVLATFNECYHCDGVHHEFSRVMSDGDSDLAVPPVFGGWQTIRPEFNTLTVAGTTTRTSFHALSADDIRRVYGYCLYPSNYFVLAPDYVLLTQFVPNGPEETIVVDELLLEGGRGFEDIVEFWRISNSQDWEMCELVQRGARHGYRRGPYSEEESITHDSERWYAQLMNGNETRAQAGP